MQMKIQVKTFRGALFFADENGNLLGQFTSQGARECTLAGVMEAMGIYDEWEGFEMHDMWKTDGG